MLFFALSAPRTKLAWPALRSGYPQLERRALIRLVREQTTIAAQRANLLARKGLSLAGPEHVYDNATGMAEFWAGSNRAVGALQYRDEDYERGCYKHLDHADRWRIRKAIEQALGSAIKRPGRLEVSDAASSSRPLSSL